MRVIALAISIAVLQVAQSLPPTDDQQFAQFGTYLESLRRQAGIPGMAAVIVGENDVAWQRSFGQQDVERGMPARTDSLFALDTTTQVFTATLVLRCVEQGKLSLDDPIGRYDAGSADPGTTIGQILTHTSGTPNNLTFAYRPERLESLKAAVESCAGVPYRETLGLTLEQMGMMDSLPGLDILQIPRSASGFPDARETGRYTGLLDRVATPYTVDALGHSSPSRYSATTLTPATGLISTALDYAKFDLAIRKAIMLGADTVAAAWRPPLGRNGQPLPHGIGWFVQPYNGETIVWQFGLSDNTSSSLVITVPGRRFSLILLANSDGLARSFGLASGDVTVSPFGRLFLGSFVR